MKSHVLMQRPKDAAPWQVRAIENYLEANWSRPIVLEDLAREIGVPLRTIFHAFKTSRSYTPMAFLHRIRLEQARRMLLAPDAATSVGAVGRKCGFKNPGHFAQYYREAFNELPSLTLSRAKADQR